MEQTSEFKLVDFVKIVKRVSMSDNDSKELGLKRYLKRERSQSPPGPLTPANSPDSPFKNVRSKRSRTNIDGAFSYFVQIQKEFQQSSVLKDASNSLARTVPRNLFSSADNKKEYNDVDILAEKIQETSL